MLTESHRNNCEYSDIRNAMLETADENNWKGIDLPTRPQKGCGLTGEHEPLQN